ncbi:chaplin [Streptomyces sp. NPDC017202]|uniref:chaplin n=1 Tax=Streptomyces sp. NPDC017202 TaxID=3364981 RepID=UPI0037B498AF
MKNLKKAAAVTMIASGLVASAAGGASAAGVAEHSPGVVSGNVAQAPVHIPVNAVGNSVDVVGVLNPAFGNLGLNH